jgi:hypothetical protein
MKLLIYTKLILILHLLVSCSNQLVIKEKLELEKALYITQEIHMYHTEYLNAEDLRKKVQSGRHLLSTLKNLDTLDYNNSILELTYQYSIVSSSTEIDEVLFGSGLYGIAWRVQFDSTLNEINKKYKIIDLEELSKKGFE